MDSLNISKCSASGKTRYADPAAAKQAIQRIKAKRFYYDGVTKKKTKHRIGKAEQCRYYYCRFCKGFHLTKIPTQVTVKSIETHTFERDKLSKGLVVTPQEAQDWKADSLPFPPLNHIQ